MADTKITALTAITTVDPANDVLPIVDVSDTSMAASGTTKKITTNQILGASGTATLASATITGDLTVDTSTLKVDSANDRVGIGTASPTQVLTVRGNVLTTAAAGTDSYANVSTDGVQNSYLGFNNSGSTNAAGASNNNTYIGNGNNYGTQIVGNSNILASFGTTGVFNWYDGAGGTRMTLNSTGLGVGVSPASDKLLVSTTAGIIAASTTADFNFRNAAGTAIQRLRYTDTDGSLTIGSATGVAYPVNIGGDTTSRAVIIDASKNVGIGVTPSAGTAGVKSLELGSLGNGIYSGATFSGTLYASMNAYNDGSWKFARNAAAGLYGLNSDKSFAWFQSSNAPSVGGAITWTQSMTLDASGNLLVGKTAISNSTLGNELRANGEVYSTQTSNTDVGTTYHAYSTLASAYRFYVGMGGTVFATNTTISAISDARLKENVQDLDVGLGAILALKPRKFDWKEGKGKNIKGDRGFIAQEFEEVFPNLIDEWKDAAPEGEAPYKSVRQDLIPVLVKAIQELTARVQTLETR